MNVAYNTQRSLLVKLVSSLDGQSAVTGKVAADVTFKYTKSGGAITTQALSATPAANWYWNEIGNGQYWVLCPAATFNTPGDLAYLTIVTGAVQYDGLVTVLSADEVVDPGDAPTGSYATEAQVETYIGTDAPADVARLISRASELIDAATFGRVDTTDTVHAAAVVTACCAQVEYWIQNREETEYEGKVTSRLAGKTLTVYKDGNPVLAPRARRVLLSAGLLYAGAGSSTYSETSFAL